jgi:sulfite exporter TauE/SafE
VGHPSLFVWALVMGLAQGFGHCSAMCGPFVLAFGLNARPPAVAAAATAAAGGGRAGVIAAHQAGRILAFAALGALAGAIGQVVDLAGRIAGLDAVAGIAGGVLMLAWAADQLLTGHGGGAVERFSLMRLAPVQALFRRTLAARTPASAFVAGGVLGLHPCGLLFAMLASAAATGSAPDAAVMLLLFGIGTAPALVGVTLAGWYGGPRLAGRRLAYASGVLAALAGVLFVLRGLSANGLVPEVNPWLF